MTLQFSREKPVYDQASGLVRFSATEDQTPLTFAVTRVALEELVDDPKLDASAIEHVFRENRDLIEQKASALWEAVKTENERRGTAPSTIDPHVLATLL
ncbi:MAG: DUF1488 family protein [Dongiaceae bacterium]